MANNPYVNKVVYGNDTLIDLTDTTAEASDVAEGKYFYNAAGSRTLGTASASVKDVTVDGTSVVNAQGVAELNSNIKVFYLSSGDSVEPSTYAEIREAYDYWEQNKESTLIVIDDSIVTSASDNGGDITFQIGTYAYSNVGSVDASLNAFQCDYTDTSTAQLELVYLDVQPLLESGTNIKTINNQSLLGSGNIAIGGDTNVIETVKVNNTALPVSSKSVNIDLSGYATTSALSNKQDTLVSGTNIKTINNQSLLGSGNIDIQAGGTVDTAMSDVSENAVQNKIIKAYVDSMILTSTDDNAGTVTISVSPSSLLNADTTGY